MSPVIAKTLFRLRSCPGAPPHRAPTTGRFADLADRRSPLAGLLRCLRKFGREVFVACLPPLWWDESAPKMAAKDDSIDFWEGLWNSMLERIRCPVRGILLSGELAERLGEPILARLVRQYRENPPTMEVTAEGLQEAAAESKQYVAEERALSGDHERHRDPADDRYEKNLSLPALQEKRSDGRFSHPEWGLLDRLLRPFGFQVLKRKGITGDDRDDVFNETLASLAVVKENQARAPIEELVVFEEIIPRFCTLIGWRAVDSVRRRTSLKARPESLQSLEAMESDEDAPVQVADPANPDHDRPDTWRFEDIYAQCREELSDVEWALLHDLYVAQRFTVKDLVEDRPKLERLGIDPNQSARSLRRRVEEIINPALEKLATALAI